MSVFDTNFVCYVPCTWNIDKMLQRIPPNVKIHRDNAYKIRDRVIYVASAYYRARATLNLDRIDDDLYVPINAAVLQGAVKDYKVYIDYLTNTVDVLETDNTYSQTRHTSRKYRFGERYRGVEVKPIYIYDAQFVIQITKYRRRGIAKARDQYPSLYEWMADLSLQRIEAERILDSLDIHQDRRRQQEHLIAAFSNPSKWIFSLSKTGRLFTHVGLLKKELRSSIRFRGLDRLVELDICNCVPFISMAFLDMNIYNKLDVASIIKLHSDYNSKVNESLLMLVDMASCGTHFKDVELFKRDVTSGCFYEKVVAAYNETYSANVSRNEAKQKIINVWNRPPDMNCRWKDIQKQLYPNVIDIFDTVNCGYFRTKKGKGKRRWREGDQVSTFAFATQRIEARILLESIVPRVERYNEEIPMYTIHDSILTTEAHADTVREIMELTFREIYGNSPQIRVTRPMARRRRRVGTASKK